MVQPCEFWDTHTKLWSVSQERMQYNASFPSSTSTSLADAKHLDCGYTLKYLEPNRKSDVNRPWSERQSCIAYFGTRGEWALISPSARMQIRMHEYCESLTLGQECHSFVLHLLFIGAAMSNWRPYLAYLTHETKEQVRLSSNIRHPADKF